LKAFFDTSSPLLDVSDSKSLNAGIADFTNPGTGTFALTLPTTEHYCLLQFPDSIKGLKFAH
jgi:hypothetical protein